MRIAVVSDTHGHVGSARAAVARIRANAVDAVLHCGDIGSPAVIPLFAGWPTHFVFGNVDDNSDQLARAIHEAGQMCHERFGDFTLAGVRTALLHSDNQFQFDEVVESGDYDLVCYGHTHVPEVHRAGKTVVLNPGALFRATPHTMAVVELPEIDVRHLVVE